MKKFETVEELKSFGDEYGEWSSVLNTYHVSLETAFNDEFYRIILLIK